MPFSFLVRYSLRRLSDIRPLNLSPLPRAYSAMSQSSQPSFASAEDISSFQKHLFHSKRILALCGAGLSAASGLPTFRGAGGMWKNHRATDLATPEAFEENPGLVWQFYAYRRHMALKANPNPAHLALAALAKKREGFVCLTQNVDGMFSSYNILKETSAFSTIFQVRCL